MSEVGPSHGLMAQVSQLVSNTMTSQGARLSVAQHIIIKFLATEGIKPAKILKRLRAQCDEQTLSKTQVFHRHNNFFSGWKTVEN